MKYLRESDLKKLEMVTKRALDEWGTNFQIGMCIEEFTEASLILTQYFFRGDKINEDELVKEGIDVLFMVMNMMHMFGNHSSWNKMFRKKLNYVNNKLGTKAIKLNEV